MRGLDPRIHDFEAKEDVDGRDSSMKTALRAFCPAMTEE
jgi:hypothetical protein